MSFPSKMTWRKKQPVEFGADNIDNTAPVDKLLDDIQHKNKHAFIYCCYAIKQRRILGFQQNWMKHCTLPGHPLNAFTEDWDGDLHSGYFEPFRYKSLNPKMITKMRYIEKADPVTEILMKKKTWNGDCIKYKKVAIKSNMIQTYENLNEDVVMCSEHLVEMAAHLDSDPDPYFDSFYNWYYAGNGNLQLICINWVGYLLHSESNILTLSKFSKSEVTVFDNEPIATFECEDNIFETICSSENIVALRTKNKIYKLKIISVHENIQFEKIKVVESELPYTSISFDNFHKNILYVTTLDCKLTIVNLDRMTGKSVKLKCQVNSLIDNWNTVIGSDRLCYTHVAKNSITFYDKRVNNPTHTWTGVRNLTDEIGCNDITVAKHSERSSLYFGTDHHLFLMDTRFQDKSMSKVVQRWTHGMQCVPTYMTICPFEYNKEIICLSSQWCEDTSVVTNYTDLKRETEIKGVSIPYHPPNILNTLKEARQKLPSFDINNPLEVRLCTAITGSIITDQEESYVILMQNSLGDISFHSLYPEHMEPFISDDSVEHLNEWSKSYKIERKGFEISSIENFAHVWKRLKKVPESHSFGEDLLKTSIEKYNEKEIFSAFENQELDNGLLDVWTNEPDDTIVDSTTMEQSSSVLNLHYSDSD